MDSQKFTPEDEAALRETLKRCSPETIEKAVELRKTGNAELAGPVVIGIIERFSNPKSGICSKTRRIPSEWSTTSASTR